LLTKLDSMRNTLIGLLFCFSLKGFSQTQCDEALGQLSSYAQQCNYLYANYYNQIVFYNSCGYYSYNCLYSLNSWYYIECRKVNNWYVSILSQCTSNTSSPTSKPGKKIDKNKIDIQQPEIEVEEIEDLADEIDENKSTRIRIPDNPIGWKP
jgi:hypothetical protein